MDGPVLDPVEVKCIAAFGVFLLAGLLIWLSFSSDGQGYVGEQVGDMPGSGGCSGVGVGAFLLLILGGATALLIRFSFAPNSGMAPSGPAEANWSTAIICGGGPFLLFAALAVFLLIAAAIGGGGRE